MNDLLTIEARLGAHNYKPLDVVPGGARRQSQPAIVARIVRAIGETDFTAVAARAVLEFAGFDMAAMLTHDHPSGRGRIFVTHTVSSMARFGTDGVSVFRAADSTLAARRVSGTEKLERIGLYFSACGNLVELDLYRALGAHVAQPEMLESLRALGEPLAAAFESHSRLTRRASLTTVAASLSPREVQIADLLLLGCGSDAIAHRLNISRHTVKDHRKRIFRKLRVGSLAEFFALHWTHGVPTALGRVAGLSRS